MNSEQRKRIKYRLAILSVIAGLSLSLGCGSSKHPELRPVSGTISLKGEPLPDATIAFYHDDASRLATGQSDADGNFQLTSFETNDGALPGEHRVVVTKTEEADSANLSMDEALNDRPNKTQSKQLVPKKYTSPRTTPLTAIVDENGSNDIVLSLD